MKILLTWLTLKVLTGTMMLRLFGGWWCLFAIYLFSGEVTIQIFYPLKKESKSKNTTDCWTSLAVQWLRICLSMQGAWIQSLVQEDSIY